MPNRPQESQEPDITSDLGGPDQIPIPTASNVARDATKRGRDSVRKAPVIRDILGKGKKGKPFTKPSMPSTRPSTSPAKPVGRPNLRVLPGGNGVPPNVPASEMNALQEAANTGAKMRAARTPKATKAPEATEKLDSKPTPIREIQRTTYKEALLILARASQAQKSGKSFEARIAGLKIEDPEKAFKALQSAFKLVAMYLFKFLKIDPDKITFEQLEGKTAGLSTTQGIKLDPAMLSHEITELGGVVFHEILHQNDTLQNEGLAQAATDVKFGTFQVTQEYKDAANKMKDFARLFNKNGDFRQGVLDIYEMCYKGLKNPKYLNQFYKDFIRNTKGVFENVEEANAYFQEIFPEYRVIKNKKVEKVSSAPTKIDKDETPPFALAA